MPRRNVIGRFVEVNSKTIVEVIAALFILLFVYTSVNKLIAIRDLRIALKSYPVIGGISEIVAWGLPLTEVIVSILLLFRSSKLIGLYSSLALMCAFTLYLTYMLTFTDKHVCTCGGMLQILTWPQHLLFNIIFIFIAIIGIYLHRIQVEN